LVPNPGYWRSTSNKTSSKILVCRKDGVTRCNTNLETFKINIFNQCEKGYQGVQCEACDSGYVETGLLQCKQCSDVAHSFLFTILSIFGFTLIKLYCINRLYRAVQSLCSSNESKENIKETLESTYYVRLLLTYTQILSMVYLFNMEVREFIGSYSQLGNPTEFTRFKLECSMQFLGIPTDYYVFGSFIFLFLSPILQFGLVVIIARLFIKKLFEPATRYFLRLCLIYIILSEQPGIVGFMTGFLSCSQADQYSDPYVGLHPSMNCNTNEYFIIRYFIVIPGLVIWGALIPIYMFRSVYSKREKLNTLKVRLPYGVLYNLYKPEYYWWGTVSMLLAISLGFTTYLFQGDLRTCLGLAFILLWIYQLAVRRAKPYKYDSWNKMEATTMGLLVLNLMLGYLTMNTPVKNLKWIGYIALVVINGAMISHIIYKIVNHKVVTLVDRFQQKLASKRHRQPRKSTKKLAIMESFLQNDMTGLRSSESEDNSSPSKSQSSQGSHQSHLLL